MQFSVGAWCGKDFFGGSFPEKVLWEKMTGQKNPILCHFCVLFNKSTEILGFMINVIFSTPKNLVGSTCIAGSAQRLLRSWHSGLHVFLLLQSNQPRTSSNC